MLQTAAVKKCCIQQLYRNVADSSCSEMLQAAAVQKCCRQQLYRNAADSSCTEMLQTAAVQKIEIHFIFSHFFFPKVVPL